MKDQPFAEPLHLFIYFCFTYQDNRLITLSALYNEMCQLNVQMENTYCMPVLQGRCSHSTDVCKQKSHLHLLSLRFILNSDYVWASLSLSVFPLNRWVEEPGGELLVSEGCSSELCKLLNCVLSVLYFKCLLKEIFNRCIVTRLYWKRLQPGEECPLHTLNLFPLKVSFVAKEIKQWLCYGADSFANNSYSQNKTDLVKLLRMM